MPYRPQPLPRPTDTASLKPKNPKRDREAGDPTGSTSLVSLRLLEVLTDIDGEMGVTQLAEVLGMPKARIHRHLAVLRNEGYVTQTERSSRYRVGWRLFLLGQRLVKHFDVVKLARPVMQDLRDLVGHTVVITTFTESKVVVLDLIRGRSQLEIFLNPGSEYMLHAAAQGKVVLAFGDPAMAKAILERPLEKSTSHTIVDADRLRGELELVRKKGWAEAPEELFMGVNALAAPIYHSGGKLFGSLALVGSIHYLPSEAKPETVAALVDAAARISNLFGTPSPRPEVED